MCILLEFIEYLSLFIKVFKDATKRFQVDSSVRTVYKVRNAFGLTQELTNHVVPMYAMYVV